MLGFIDDVILTGSNFVDFVVEGGHFGMRWDAKGVEEVAPTVSLLSGISRIIMMSRVILDGLIVVLKSIQHKDEVVPIRSTSRRFGVDGGRYGVDGFVKMLNGGVQIV